MCTLRAPSCPLLSQETKRLLRQEFADEWAAFAHGEADYAWNMLSSPAVVKQLGAVMRRLQQGSKQHVTSDASGGGGKDGSGPSRSKL